MAPRQATAKQLTQLNIDIQVRRWKSCGNLSVAANPAEYGPQQPPPLLQIACVEATILRGEMATSY